MDRAFRRQDEARATRQRETVRNPVTDEVIALGAHDLTIADIFKNDQAQDLFVNYFLRGMDTSGGLSKAVIAAQFNAQPLTEDQHLGLERARTQFNARRAQAEQMRKHFSDADLGEMAERDERIQVITGKKGPAFTLDFLKGHIADLAIKNPDRFDEIANSLKTVHSVRKGEKAARVDKLVDSRIKQYKLTDDTYLAATSGDSTEEIRKALQGAVASKLTGFKAALSFIFKRRGANKLYESFQEQKALIDECNQCLLDVANVLRVTISEQTVGALHDAAVNGKDAIEEKRGSGIQSIRQLREARDANTTAKIIERYKTARDTHVKNNRSYGGSNKWDDLPNNNSGKLGYPIALVRDAFVAAETNRQDALRRDGDSFLISLLEPLLLKQDEIRTAIDSV